MVAAVHQRVRASLAARRFPLIYGADCTVLLGAIPALKDVHGTAGLVFIDGHEDATRKELSASGEAANIEIVLLLGITSERAPSPLHASLGVPGPAGGGHVGIARQRLPPPDRRALDRGGGCSFSQQPNCIKIRRPPRGRQPN
jgi:hypothetical protein